MKQKIWVSPVPGVALRGVILKKVFHFWYKVLYRDCDKKCYISYEPSRHIFTPRS